MVEVFVFAVAPVEVRTVRLSIRFCPLPVVKCFFGWPRSYAVAGVLYMVGRRGWSGFLITLCVVALLGFGLWAQQMSPAGQYPNNLLSGLQWRDVGPMRAGRSYAVAGNATQPDTFYMGSVGGGVWKTENAGRTWFPIADDPA